MWRKIIEKMYDPEDSSILEQKFYDVIQFREENAENNTPKQIGYNQGGY
jgi:hypothetical protein